MPPKTAARLERRRESARRYYRKHKAKVNARKKAFYAANKNYFKENYWKRRKRVDEFLDAAKSKPCTDCKKKYPSVVMDFDHRPGEEKLADIGTLRVRACPVEIIAEEVAKCDLVCSNCHRIRTAERRAKCA